MVLHFETLAWRVKLCKPSDFNGIGLHSTRPFQGQVGQPPFSNSEACQTRFDQR
jgi:hypothetical protein